MKEVNFVSLGAGVQSSTLALRFKELTGKNVMDISLQIRVLSQKKFISILLG